jgi:hypothetical protein
MHWQVYRIYEVGHTESGWLSLPHFVFMHGSTELLVYVLIVIQLINNHNCSLLIVVNFTGEKD